MKGENTCTAAGTAAVASGRSGGSTRASRASATANPETAVKNPVKSRPLHNAALPGRRCQFCNHGIAWLWSICRTCGEPDPEWRILNDPRIKSEGECLLWMGARTATGYGRYGERYAHRIAWEQANDASADGHEVMHSCDNPPCVNPAHLRLATHAENMRDAMSKGRMDTEGLQRRGEWTHCKNGHEFTEENTYRQPSNGSRSCRICRREAFRRWSKANR